MASESTDTESLALAGLVKDVRCRLLELPAELRIRIYEACLAPTGTLCLTATKTKRYATTPELSPKLLCTCRQIYTEAQDILDKENRICFSIDAHDTSWPVISEKRLPQHVLERMQNACIVFDAATTFYSYYRNINWTALTALISLQTLQISIIHRREPGNSESVWMSFYDLLEEVLERIPASTIITYGTKEDTPERTFLETVMAKRLQGSRSVTIQELTTEEYAELVDVASDVERGAKSGGVDDVYAEDREDRMKMYSRLRVEPKSQLRMPGSEA